jgi:dephospho-CoA kinase
LNPKKTIPPQATRFPVRVVGLTGGMGAGKSEVLRVLGEMGAAVLQADQVGHGLLKERHFSKTLAKRFGRGILDSKGLVDRQKLGTVVFKDKAKRKSLNRILHPVIRRKIKLWVAGRQIARNRAPLLVVEIPLLFEGKGYPYLDGVLSVSASARERQRRLLARGWDKSEIRRREKGQWAQARKDRKAHWVIRNNGSLQDLRRQVKVWFEKTIPSHKTER